MTNQHGPVLTTLTWHMNKEQYSGEIINSTLGRNFSYHQSKQFIFLSLYWYYRLYSYRNESGQYTGLATFVLQSLTHWLQSTYHNLAPMMLVDWIATEFLNPKKSQSIRNNYSPKQTNAATVLKYTTVVKIPVIQ